VIHPRIGAIAEPGVELVDAAGEGTHLDAMYHFVDDGKTLDQMPLDWFYGPATVLRIPKAPREEITPDDFRCHESVLVPEAKIIYETGWHRRFGVSVHAWRTPRERQPITP
jgi:kynurenine formamidase